MWICGSITLYVYFSNTQYITVTTTTKTTVHWLPEIVLRQPIYIMHFRTAMTLWSFCIAVFFRSFAASPHSSHFFWQASSDLLASPKKVSSSCQGTYKNRSAYICACLSLCFLGSITLGGVVLKRISQLPACVLCASKALNQWGLRPHWYRGLGQSGTR